MLILGVALAVVGLAALAAAIALHLAESRRVARRKQAEQDAARAALEYLTKFGVRCATAAMAVGDQKFAILIETEPQKKLRFSYIIEQPLRDYVNKATGLNVRWVYWRFPVPEKLQRVPEIKYGAPDTIAMLDNRDVLPPPEQQIPAGQSGDGDSVMDEYFQEHDYQIEEVGWDQFDTVTRQPSDLPPKPSGA